MLRRISFSLYLAFAIGLNLALAFAVLAAAPGAESAGSIDAGVCGALGVCDATWWPLLVVPAVTGLFAYLSTFVSDTGRFAWLAPVINFIGANWGQAKNDAEAQK